MWGAWPWLGVVLWLGGVAGQSREKVEMRITGKTRFILMVCLSLEAVSCLSCY